MREKLIEKINNSQEYFNFRVSVMNADDIRVNAERIAARNEAWRASDELVYRVPDETVEMLLNSEDPLEVITLCRSLNPEEVKEIIQSETIQSDESANPNKEQAYSQHRILKKQLEDFAVTHKEAVTNSWLLRCRDLFKSEDYIGNPYSDMATGMYNISKKYDAFVVQEVYEKGAEYGVRPNELEELAIKVDKGMLIQDDVDDDFFERLDNEFDAYMRRISQLSAPELIKGAEKIFEMQQIYQHLREPEGIREQELQCIEKIQNPLHAVADCYQRRKCEMTEMISHALWMMKNTDMGEKYGIQQDEEQQGGMDLS